MDQGTTRTHPPVAALEALELTGEAPSKRRTFLLEKFSRHRCRVRWLVNGW